LIRTRDDDDDDDAELVVAFLSRNTNAISYTSVIFVYSGCITILLVSINSPFSILSLPIRTEKPLLLSLYTQ